MNTQETNAVLAGLRLLQSMRDTGRVPQSILDILHGDHVDDSPLTNESIDTLCERLNSSEPHMIAFGNPFDGINLVGPFDGYNDALRCAMKDTSPDWHIVKIQLPSEEAS